MSCTETACCEQPEAKDHPTQRTASGLLRYCLSSLFFLFFSFFSFQDQCCFTSTETIRTIRDGDGESRTATSTFSRLLSSEIDLHEGHHITRPRRHGIRARDTLNFLHSLGYRNRYLVPLVRPWTLSSVSTSGSVYRSAICRLRGLSKRCFVCGQCSGPFPVLTYEASSGR